MSHETWDKVHTDVQKIWSILKETENWNQNEKYKNKTKTYLREEIP